MKKVWHWFLYLIILAGFPLLIWASYSLTADTYMFWKYGVEKEAAVIALDHTSSSGKGGSTYYYELEIDMRRVVEGFRYKLPVGKNILVLTLPENPEKVSMGNSNSTLFEIFSYSMGGKFMAFLSIGFFIFMIYAGPSTLMLLLKNRDAFINE